MFLHFVVFAATFLAIFFVLVSMGLQMTSILVSCGQKTLGDLGFAVGA